MRTLLVAAVLIVTFGCQALAGTLSITVRDTFGKEWKIAGLSKASTICDIKKRIQGLTGLAVGQQKLMWGGSFQDNAVTLGRLKPEVRSGIAFNLVQSMSKKLAQIRSC